MSEGTRRAYQLSLDTYSRQTDRLNEIAARVVAAGEDVREWWWVRTESQERRPGVVPRDGLRRIANWAGPRSFGGALVDWDSTRVTVLQMWDQLEEDERAQVDPPWDPFAAE